MAELSELTDAPERVEWLELFFDLVVVAAGAVPCDALREAGGRFLGLGRHGLRERRADR